MNNGSPIQNEATCAFIKDYVKLSENSTWVQKTKQTLKLV